jgi:hypothetical protein
MALNPPLTADGEPLRVENEHFWLRRKGIEFEVDIKGLGKMKGKGIVSIINFYINNISNLVSIDYFKDHSYKF